MTASTQQVWCATLVLALGHFLWQGTLVAVALEVARRATRSVVVRYWLSLAALLVMAVCPVATWSWLLRVERTAPSLIPPIVFAENMATPQQTPRTARETSEIPQEPAVPAPPNPATTVEKPVVPATSAVLAAPSISDSRRSWHTLARPLTALYLAGVAGMFVRLIIGLWGGQSLRQRVMPIDDPFICFALRRQSRALGLRLLPLVAYCDQVCVPTVVGVLKPMILLPLSLTSQLSPEQLEAILAHELAHLKRGDHWVNLLQRIIESILFFHPAIWWVSRCVRDERELCCDDRVVACGAIPLKYAESLLRVAELGHASSPRGAVVAVSILASGGRPSHLRRRIARLLGDATAPSLRLTPRILLLAIGLTLLTLMVTMRGGAANAVTSMRTAPNFSADTKHVEITEVEAQKVAKEKTELASAITANAGVLADDWPQWGFSPQRNNVAAGQTAPRTWSVERGENIQWSAPLGTPCYSSPIVANGKLFIGANNGQAYVKEHPATEDLGCLLAFDVRSGKFLWQDSNRKLPSGRAEDWPLVGISSTPYCESDRVWYVTNRAEVVCLDADGFHDNENDGPVTDEPHKSREHADVIWRFDLRERFGVRPRHATNCSVTCLGDRLFVVVSHSHAVAEPETLLTRPEVPSFVCLDKRSGKILWVDTSATRNILDCQWSSPCVFEAGGQWQVVMGGGDGWVYSFDPEGDGQGRSKLLWKFDTNPKASLYVNGSKGTRNYCVAAPVFYDGLVYLGNGQEPEHGEGVGHLYCINPTKRGDVSAELAVDAQTRPLAARRLQAIDAAQGEKAIPNPNSAMVWHYSQTQRQENRKPSFTETFHRTLGSVAIANDLLFVADFSGVLHCLDTKKSVDGRPLVHWTHDLMAASWSTPLIADGKVYVADEDGDVAVFQLAAQKTAYAEQHFGEPIYSTPALAHNTLFLATRSKLFAIREADETPVRTDHDRSAESKSDVPTPLDREVP